MVKMDSMKSIPPMKPHPAALMVEIKVALCGPM